MRIHDGTYALDNAMKHNSQQLIHQKLIDIMSFHSILIYLCEHVYYTRFH